MSQFCYLQECKALSNLDRFLHISFGTGKAEQLFYQMRNALAFTYLADFGGAA